MSKPLATTQELYQFAEVISNLKMYCPFCGYHIHFRDGRQYYCTNPKCYASFYITRKN